MVAELSVPVTVKMRLLESNDNDDDGGGGGGGSSSSSMSRSIAFAQMLEEAGASMITVHGRTIKQNKQRCGESNRQIIRAIKQSLNIPVVANGGIEVLGYWGIGTWEQVREREREGGGGHLIFPY
jgi:tRNA-dihydrouridine synthase